MEAEVAALGQRHDLGRRTELDRQALRRECGMTHETWMGGHASRPGERPAREGGLFSPACGSQLRSGVFSATPPVRLCTWRSALGERKELRAPQARSERPVPRFVAFLVQGPRFLSLVRRSPDGRHRCAPRPSRVAGGARAAVVLSLPFALRYRLAYDAPLVREVLAVFVQRFSKKGPGRGPCSISIPIWYSFSSSTSTSIAVSPRSERPRA
jgi:hypothetical protein